MKNVLQKQRALIIACAGMFALAFTVFYALAGRGGSDISIHATWASEIVFTDVRSFVHHGAHPLWHTLVALMMRLGLSVRLSAALVTAALKTAELGLAFGLLSKAIANLLPRAAVAACAVVAMLVGPLCLPWVNPTVYLGVGTPNTWHSPTQMIALVFMLLCVPMTARLYEQFEASLPEGKPTPWKEAALLSGLLLASLVAKPTFMQAFVPAAGLFFLIEWIRRPRQSRFFWRMILIFLPSALMMVFQYMFYFGIITPYQGGVAMGITGEKLWLLLRNTMLIQAFPLYVLLAWRKKGVYRDRLVWLSLLLDAAGILEMLVFAETGRRADDGNFGWAMMSGALMLWVVMTARYFACYGEYRRLPEKPRKEKQRLALGATLLGWHLVSGCYYLFYLLTTTNCL